MFHPEYLSNLILLLTLLVATISDSICYRIPNKTVFLGMAAVTAAHLAAPPVVELWAVAAGGALLLVMLLLFHLHMTGAGDVKLLMLVLYAAPDGRGLWIWLLGLAVAGVLGACRLTGLGLWKERLCRLEQCLRDAGAGRRIIYYDRKRDGTRAVIPMAGCILLAACAVMAAGGTGV